MVITHQHGYYTSTWFLHINMVITHQHGYYTSTWFLHINKVITHQQGYVSLVPFRAYYIPLIKQTLCFDLIATIVIGTEMYSVLDASCNDII